MHITILVVHVHYRRLCICIILVDYVKPFGLAGGMLALFVYFVLAPPTPSLPLARTQFVMAERPTWLSYRAIYKQLLVA